jgi:16S rRNA processing protein RimM
LGDVSSETLIPVGKVIRPHGLNGFMRVFSYAKSGETFLQGGVVLLKSGENSHSEHKVISITAHKNAFLMRLEGISSLEDAEGYRGAEILIRKDALRRESDDEFFWFELIGLEVFLDSGRFIGTLEEIIDTGSNDIYVVKDGNKEALIPAIHGIVLAIDLQNRRMIIADNIDGLLDIDEV